MSLFVPIALFGWLPFVMILFALLPAQRAVAWSFSLGWCFLPVAGYSIPGLPDYEKASAISYGVLLGALLFHGSAITKFRPRFVDLPMLLWCVCPLASSWTNRLGLYDGVSESINSCVIWGIPYFVGRLFFRHQSDLRNLVIPVVASALLYIPFCLFEIRMSPQLHTLFYGFHQHQFAQSMRGGGWRPTVFMNHGLQVAMWMGSAVLITGALCFFGPKNAKLFDSVTRRKWIWLIALGVTFLLLKSTGALLLVMSAFGAMAMSKSLRSSMPIIAISVMCVLFLGVRATGVWRGDQLVQLAEFISEERAESLQFRLTNEEILAEKARQRSTFGWGGWGRARVYDENGKDISVTDSLWVIAFGNHGYVGLAGLYGALLIGPVLLAWRCRPEYWSSSRDSVFGAAISLVCLLAAVDSLFNAMPIPLVTMAIGAAAGTSQQVRYPSRGYRAAAFRQLGHYDSANTR